MSPSFLAEGNFAAHRELLEHARRWQEQLELNVANEETFYTSGPKGYIDYPFAD